MKRRTLDDETLTRALRALAEAEGRVETPSRVEAAVMARWDAAHAPRHRSATRRLVRIATAMAAGVTLVSAVALERKLASGPLALPDRPWLASGPLALPERPALAYDASDGSRTNGVPDIDEVELRSAFNRASASSINAARSAVVLVGQPIGEGEVVHVVRMRVTRASLRMLGVSAPSSGETVDIDVVVGEDGVARGVRVPL